MFFFCLFVCLFVFFQFNRILEVFVFEFVLEAVTVLLSFYRLNCLLLKEIFVIASEQQVRKKLMISRAGTLARLSNMRKNIRLLAFFSTSEI